MNLILLTAIALVVRIVSNPMGNVLQKQLSMQGQHPMRINFITYFLLSCSVVFFAAKLQWVALPAVFWMYAVAAGFCGALGNGFLIKALQLGDLSVLGPVNSYKSVIGMIFAILLLGEFPNIWGLAGVALIIWGSYFVLDTTSERFSWKLLQQKEIRYRIWAMILTAIEAVLIKKIIQFTDPSAAFYCWCFFGAFFSGIALLFLKDIKNPAPFAGIFNTNLLVKYAVLVACIGAMQFTTNYVFGHMQVGYALSLFQLSTLISVLLGWRLFGEQQIRKKLLGSFIMILGSVLIILLK